MPEEVHILLFHRVHPVRNPLWDPMDPVLFREILTWANRKYTVLGMNEFFFEERRKFKRPPAIITFDDGYHDFLDYSFPVLKALNMPSTLFVVTDCIDSNTPTWTYKLDHLFFHTHLLTTPVPPDVPGFTMMDKWRTADERTAFGSRLKQHLKKIPAMQRNNIIQFYENAFSDVRREENTMLSWDEIKYLNQHQVEIGSHTLTHPPLATVDEQEMEKEMLQSGIVIRNQLGRFPSAISYPVGSYNNKVKNMARRTGYKLGFVVDQKIYRETVRDRYSIPRLELYNESFFKTKMRVNGIISRLKALSGR